MFHKLVFRKHPWKKVYLKTYLSNTPNTVDQIQIQIQIHGLKFDQIQIQIRRICICICICKYKYDLTPALLYNNLFIYQVLCTPIYRRRSLYSFLFDISISIEFSSVFNYWIPFCNNYKKTCLVLSGVCLGL